jgi:hypothetical protein
MPIYNLPALEGIDPSYREIPHNLKTAALEEVAKAFVGNVDRVVSTGRLPVRLLNLSGHFEPVLFKARTNISPNFIPFKDKQKFSEVVQKLVVSYVRCIAGKLSHSFKDQT